jgi:hypothetical protein
MTFGARVSLSLLFGLSAVAPAASAHHSGCSATEAAGCHTPPLYTNSELTPVEGFVVPEESKKSHDILPIVVDTDPTSALTTARIELAVA